MGNGEGAPERPLVMRRWNGIGSLVRGKLEDGPRRHLAWVDGRASSRHDGVSYDIRSERSVVLRDARLVRGLGAFKLISIGLCATRVWGNQWRRFASS